MDLILLIIGIVLIVLGAKMKDRSGQRSGGGVAQMTIGVVITVVGGLWFFLGFVRGFSASQM